MVKKLLIGLMVAALVAVGAGKVYYDKSTSAVDSRSTDKIEVVIPEESTTDDIGKLLADKGIIKSSLMFKAMSRLEEKSADYKAGTYQLSKSMSVFQVIDRLVGGGDTAGAYKVTIPEGSELKQIAEILSQEGLVDAQKFMEVASNADAFKSKHSFLRDVPQGASLEGYVYPNTYYFGEDDKDKPEQIIEKMLGDFSEHFGEDMIEKGKKLGLNIHQTITLASLVEREAQVEKDRPVISAVFLNRLEKGMYLESCASVQYIIGERKPVLSLDDIAIDSPYNTYRNGGLPPGPIASPGESSISAAVNPANVEYLFFMAKGDGSHIFSNTFEEHLKVQQSIQNK